MWHARRTCEHLDGILVVFVDVVHVGQIELHSVREIRIDVVSHTLLIPVLAQLALKIAGLDGRLQA